MTDKTNITQNTAHNTTSLRRTKAWYFLAIPILAVLLTLSLNHVLIGSPVQKKLDNDTRNNGYSLRAHYNYYIDANTLVLDLRKIENAAPVDLFRALFQSAAALHESGRRFDQIILARGGTPVFLMKGEEFSTIGVEFAAGQNPIYLIRTLPEKLYKPNGEAAFGHWEGGWIVVLGKQMEDAKQVGQQWATGR